MNAAMSGYLDAIRFTAALTVFLSHASGYDMSGGLLWRMHRLGGSAVVVFFVLSGFLIAFSTARARSANHYAVSRAARILSVSIPAVFLTVALDHIGSAVRPDIYAGSEYKADGIATQVILALVFLNESWGGHISMGTNGPYWSISFEVWYYIVFGWLYFSPTRAVALISAVICLLIAGPQITLLFPLWLLGAAAYYMSANNPVSPAKGALVFATTGLAGALMIASIILARHENPAALNGMRWNDLGPEYALGVVFAANLFGAWHVSSAIKAGTGRLLGLLQWLAGSTLTLYLLHLPLLFFVRAICPWPDVSLRRSAFVLGGVLVLVVALSYLTERQRDPWRRAIAALFRTTGLQHWLERFRRSAVIRS